MISLVQSAAGSVAEDVQAILASDNVPDVKHLPFSPDLSPHYFFFTSKAKETAFLEEIHFQKFSWQRYITVSPTDTKRRLSKMRSTTGCYESIQ